MGLQSGGEERGNEMIVCQSRVTSRLHALNVLRSWIAIPYDPASTTSISFIRWCPRFLTESLYRKNKKWMKQNNRFRHLAGVNGEHRSIFYRIQEMARDWELAGGNLRNLDHNFQEFYQKIMWNKFVTYHWASAQNQHLGQSHRYEIHQ